MKLAIVEVLDRDGHTRLIVPVSQWPVTIGRAVDCDVVIDDPHVAPLHATLTDADGVLTVLAGQTLNGVGLPGRHLAAHEHAGLSAGEPFLVGGTRLRVRRPSDPLADERPLTQEAFGSLARTLTALGAIVLWSLGTHWLGTDPGGPFTDALFVVIGVLLAIGLWSGLWAVGSKLLQQRFEFWRHVRAASVYFLLIGLLSMALPLASYTSGWTLFSKVSGIVGGAAAWALVLAHLRLLMPARTRLLTAVMAAIFVATLAVYLTRTYQVHDRLFDELYVTTLGPPALRLAPTVPVERFIDESRTLEGALAAHIDDDTPESGTPSPDAGEP